MGYSGCDIGVGEHTWVCPDGVDRDTCIGVVGGSGVSK